MKRLTIFLAFSLVGLVLAFSDALLVEQALVIVMFMLVGFIGSLIAEDRYRPRFPVMMHAVYAYPDSSGGEGVVEDVSLNGCKVRSTKPSKVKAELRLHFFPPDQGEAIEIQRAVVRWTGDGEFGVQFHAMGDAHQQRLENLINKLANGEV